MAIDSSSNSGEQPADYSSWMLPEVTSGGVTVSTVEKELKEQERKDALREAGEAIEDLGEVESDEVVDIIEDSVAPLTAEQLQEITEAAEKEGYEAGFKKGREEGEQQGYRNGQEKSDTQLREYSERMQHVIDALLIPLETEQQKLEHMLVGMVSKLAEALVKRELLTDSSCIQKTIESVLQLLPPNHPTFTLYLNPDDVDLANQYLQKKIRSDAENTPGYQIQTDEQLLPGGCRLENSETTIDATVETRLTQLLDDFAHKRLAEDEANTEPTEVNKVTESSTADTPDSDPDLPSNEQPQ